MAVCDADEDTLTLAWRAADAALDAAGVDAGEVSGLWWGTARPPFAEGPSHAFLATTLGLDRRRRGCAAERVAPRRDGSAHRRLGRAGGRPRPRRAGGDVGRARPRARDDRGDDHRRRRGGHGARCAGRQRPRARRPTGRPPRRAWWPGRRGPCPPSTATAPTAAAPPGTSTTPGCSAKRSSCPCSTDTGRAAGRATPAPRSGAWAIADPDGKLAAAVAKRLGAPLASAPVYGALGDTGAAAALLGLVHACADDGSGPRHRR